MPVEGRDETVVGTSYPALEQPGSWEFDRPMTRIDVFVFDNDIYMLPSETDPPTFNNPRAEMRIYAGFKSTPFETPVTGVKFRAVAGTARVTMHAFS